MLASGSNSEGAALDEFAFALTFGDESEANMSSPTHTCADKSVVATVWPHNEHSTVFMMLNVDTLLLVAFVCVCVASAVAASDAVEARVRETLCVVRACCSSSPL
jgi:hypothetical protein